MDLFFETRSIRIWQEKVYIILFTFYIFKNLKNTPKRGKNGRPLKQTKGDEYGINTV